MVSNQQTFVFLRWGTVKQQLAQSYFKLVIAVGAAVCFISVYSLQFAALDLRFLLLMLIASGLSSRITIRIPRFSSEVSISDTIIFLTMLLYDGEAAILLAAVEPLCSSLRICKKPITMLFNSAQMACSTFVTVWTLRLILGGISDLPQRSLTQFITALCLMGIAQYLANSWIVAIAGAIKARQPVWQTWVQHYLWSSITYFAGALAAGIAAKFARTVSVEAMLVTIPIMVIVYYTYRMYLNHVESSAAQAEQAERHVEELSRYIAERERAQAALRESEEKYRLLVENIPDVAWTADQQGKCLFISSNFERVCGYTPEEIYGEGGSRWAKQIHPDDLARVCASYALLFTERRMLDLEYRIQRKDGVWIWVHEKAVSTHEKDGVMYADGLLSDITERRVLESQLRQAQKLESIGQLAAGIAHEINTPLQYVSDNTRFVQDGCRELTAMMGKYRELLEANRHGDLSPQLMDEVEAMIEESDIEYLMTEIPQAIEQSLEGAGQVTKIVRSIKEFAHPGVAEKQAADLNKAIESTITVARNEWKYVAEMTTDFDSHLPLVPCLLGEFNQVVLNLIINASHAIGDVVGDGAKGKGQITISTRHDEKWAEIRVSDTGSGIPDGIRTRIFDPFFTTKAVGKGTGQGLAISHHVVVEKHGGQIAFESQVGQGTTFIIRLPLAEQ